MYTLICTYFQQINNIIQKEFEIPKLTTGKEKRLNEKVCETGDRLLNGWDKEIKNMEIDEVQKKTMYCINGGYLKFQMQRSETMREEKLVKYNQELIELNSYLSLFVL